MTGDVCLSGVGVAERVRCTMRSEDELGAKLDVCLANGLLKTGAGLAVGLLASVVLFKRRPFAVWLGLGMGAGMGYSDCSHDLQRPYLLRGKLVPAGKPTADAHSQPAQPFVIVDRSA